MDLDRRLRRPLVDLRKDSLTPCKFSYRVRQYKGETPRLVMENVLIGWAYDRVHAMAAIVEWNLFGAAPSPINLLSYRYDFIRMEDDNE